MTTSGSRALWGSAATSGFSVGWWLVGAILVAVVGIGVSDQACNWWIAYWTSGAEKQGANPTQQEVDMQVYRLNVYIGLVALNVFSNFAGYGSEAAGQIVAMNRLHHDLLGGTMAASLAFHDQTTVGRTLNRFSSDMFCVDHTIVRQIGIVFGGVVYFVLSLVMVSATSWWCLPLLPFILWALYKWLYLIYRGANRELQRGALGRTSQVFSVFSEAMTGAPTLRALQLVPQHGARALYRIDMYQRTKLLLAGAMVWLQFRLQLLMFPLTMLTTVLPVIFQLTGSSKGGDAGWVGVALSFTLALSGNVGNLITQAVELEKQMCSLERIQEYTTSQQKHQEADKDDQAATPTSSDIEKGPTAHTHTTASPLPLSHTHHQQQQQGLTVTFRSVEVRHRPSLPPALRNVTLTIDRGERVGLVGRTGAGKTTFLSTLVGLVPVSGGELRIGDRGADEWGGEMRAVVGVLPNAPLVFRGWTVRQFLDPTGEHSTEALWHAVHQCSLDSVVRKLPHQLETVIWRSPLDDNQKRESKDKMPPSAERVESDDGITTTTQEKALSDGELHQLAVGRLLLQSSSYRLILVDEPPLLVTPTTPAAPDEQQCLQKQKGQGGTTSYEGPVPLLSSVLPHCTIIVVAHHADALRGCGRVVVLREGQVVGEASGSTIETQEDLEALLERYGGTERTDA